MTFHGRIANGQIVLDESVALPDGAAVDVEVRPKGIRITSPAPRRKIEPFKPIEMAGPPLSEQLIRDRR